MTQLTSTFFVYLLGILTIGVGVNFLRLRNDEYSRLWWGLALLLWGIGALLAGTSYQAYGYQIQVRGRETCAWTNWWEVIYLMFQQASMEAQLAAVAYSCTQGRLQTLLLGFAFVSAVVYILLTFIGGILPIRSSITIKRAILFPTFQIASIL